MTEFITHLWGVAKRPTTPVGAVVCTPEDPWVGFPHPRGEPTSVNGPHSQKGGAWNLMWQSAVPREGEPQPAWVCGLPWSAKGFHRPLTSLRQMIWAQGVGGPLHPILRGPRFHTGSANPHSTVF